MKRTLYTVYRDRYRYLFTAALAVCGNELAAEDALADSVTEAGADASFDRSLKLLLRRASESAGEDCQAEFLCDSSFADETADVRRAVLLRYGLKLSRGRIARIMGVSRGQLHDLLARVSGRKGVAAACERELRAGTSAPDYATFRSMLEGRRRENAVSRTKPRAARAVIGLILVLLICGLTWMCAVLTDYYIRAVNAPVVEVTDGDG